jgi:RNA recognition motif-containing protein
VPSVRLFVGNLPYQATEEDLRLHFGAVGQPTQIVRPLDRETGRARGFAFIEYADRATAEAAIQQFDGQLFMGRPLAVSEARAREDRGPGGPPRTSGYGPRPGGTGPPRPGDTGGPGSPRPSGYSPRPGGYGAPRAAGPGEGGAAAARERNFGPPAPPKGKKGKASFQQKERGPKGPIPTKFTGRMYDLDDLDQAEDTADQTPDFMKPDLPLPDDDESAGSND